MLKFYSPIRIIQKECYRLSAVWLKAQNGLQLDRTSKRISDFFFDPYFIKADIAETDRDFIRAFAEGYDPELNRDQWFQSLKNLAIKLGYAASIKEFKAEPQKSKGHVGDLAMILQVAVTGSTENPDFGKLCRYLDQIAWRSG